MGESHDSRQTDGKLFVLKPQKIDKNRGEFMSNISTNKAIGSIFNNQYSLPMDSLKKS